MTSSIAWSKIFDDLGLHNHNFDVAPAEITATQIKQVCQRLTRVTDKGIYRLRKQYNREDHPQIFKDKGLFVLPKRNGSYYIVKGEGYVDTPNIADEVQDYHPTLGFELKSSVVGGSGMQHVDFAYANSLIRTLTDDPSLVLTICGRKYSPDSRHKTQNFGLRISNIQTEVDTGYEGRDFIVLVEAKSSSTSNIVIRQLYLPYRRWTEQVKGRMIHTLLFGRGLVGGELTYYTWQFGLRDINDYDSTELNRPTRYRAI